MAEQMSVRQGSHNTFFGLHLFLFLAFAAVWLFLGSIILQPASGLTPSLVDSTVMLLGPVVAWGVLLAMHAVVVVGTARRRPTTWVVVGALVLVAAPILVGVAVVVAGVVLHPVFIDVPPSLQASVPDPWLVPRMFLNWGPVLWSLLAGGAALTVLAIVVKGKERYVAEDRRERDDQQDGSIRTHVSVYLTFGLFFLILNLLTGPGDLWFYWPMLGWGMVLMMHAFAVYGADAPVKLVELVQSFAARLTPERPVPPVIRQAPAARTRATAASAAPAAEAPLDHVVSEGEARVDAMRARARRIPKPVIRDQALRLSASADRILAVLGETPENQQLASDFVSRYLTPAEAIVSRYARLAARDVPSAAPTLAKVESEDLPLLEQKMSELYDRLHRGDLIDLEVAREMLAFDFASTPAFPRSDTLRQTTADTSPVRS